MHNLEVHKIPVFFILGKSRSGTTLLQTMLDAHPNAIVPVESIFLLYLKKKYFNIKIWDDKRINQFINDLYKERKFCYFWNVNREKLSTELKSLPKKNISYSEICKHIYLNYSSVFTKEEIVIIGDKNPVYPFFIADILAVFPDAKFIHLIRDYKDVIVSSREVLANRSVARFAYEWKYVNEEIEKAKNNNPTSFYTLKYENLVYDSEFYLKEICNFLSLPYSAKMLDFYERPASAYYNLSHKNTLYPINDKNINKWKKKLSEKEILTADLIAGKLGKKYDYKKNKIKINVFLSIRFLGAIISQKAEIFIFKWYQKMPIGFKNFKANFAQKFHILSYHSQAEDRFKKEK
ncbi:MAG TPA: sulfotransferase [Bacteroidia bacterium]|nr:sulfotransferase [Bacteroidia bacterium]